MKGHPVLTNGTGKLILPSVGPCPSRPEPETETDETKYRQSADRGHGWGAMLHRECCRDTETRADRPRRSVSYRSLPIRNIWTRISNHHSLMLVREEVCYWFPVLRCKHIAKMHRHDGKHLADI